MPAVPAAQPAGQAAAPMPAAPAGGSNPMPASPAPEAAAGMTPQADSPQGGQAYVIQHPWPGTEGPLTIKKQGVEKKIVEPKKNLTADEVVVA